MASIRWRLTSTRRAERERLTNRRAPLRNAGILLRHMHNWEFSLQLPAAFRQDASSLRAIERSCNTLLLTTRSKVFTGD